MAAETVPASELCLAPVESLQRQRTRASKHGVDRRYMETQSWGMGAMSKTNLKKLVIEKFRALNNVEVEFGDYITVVCGKNGTSKSSILGIAAQIFSFDKDYEKGEALAFRQIAGGPFSRHIASTSGSQISLMFPDL
jgi:hypothetical protein